MALDGAVLLLPPVQRVLFSTKSFAWLSPAFLFALFSSWGLFTFLQWRRYQFALLCCERMTERDSFCGLGRKFCVADSVGLLSPASWTA